MQSLILHEFIFSALINKNDTEALFSDLRRAFETFNHIILLEKLDLYDIRGNALNIIKSYLNDKKHCL